MARSAVQHAPTAFFLPIDRGGHRLCVLHWPQAEVSRAIVYVHPFADEMNKTRRMAALQSRALARAGCAVLQIDLLGCGDSSGDFGDATWDDWVQDTLDALAWLRQRTDAPCSLWGLRAGCLVASAAASRSAEPVSLVCWQPTSSGKPLVQQFLRLAVAAQMQSGTSKGLMKELRGELAAGRALDVAGYRLAPALADGLEAALLSPSPAARHLVWLEVSTRHDATLPPASAASIAGWRAAGAAVHAEVVFGPAFWQTTEIEEAPALIDATLAAVTAPVPT